MNVIFSGGPLSGMREHNAQLRAIWRRGKIVIDIAGFRYVYKPTGKTTIESGRSWAEYVFIDPEIKG